MTPSVCQDFASEELQDRDVEKHMVGLNSKLLKVRDGINIPREKKKKEQPLVEKKYKRFLKDSRTIKRREKYAH